MLELRTVPGRVAVPLIGRRRRAAVVDFDDGAVLDAWRTASVALRKQRPSGGVATLFGDAPHPLPPSPQAMSLPFLLYASQALPALISATRTSDLYSALEAALPLVGAGPGLTPSWDDLLMGYLCGLQSCAPGGHGGRDDFLDGFGRALAAVSPRPTQASQDWIARTLSHDGPPWILTVLDAIASGDAALCARRAARALGVGHTSGADGLLGALLGSAAWQTGRQAEDLIGLMHAPASPYPRAPT